MILIDRPDENLDELVRQVSRSTHGLRSGRSDAISLSSIGNFFVDYVWPLLDVPNHRRSYRKIVPICGSVSSVRVTEEVLGPAAPSVERYVRACPVGPVTPIVLAPTMCRDELELTLTCRMATYSRETAERILSEVIDSLCEWVG